MSHYSMKELPVQERPYERCLERGPEALSDAELLAVIIRTGAQGESSLDLARKVLSLGRKEDGLSTILHLSAPELCSLKGIGEVKAVQILCVGELSKRIAQSSREKELVLDSPGSIAAYYMERMRHQEQEDMVAVFFDTKNHLLKDMLLTRGTVNSSLVSPREIFIEALRYHAVYVVLLHNHPSGNPEPSKEDMLVTQRIEHSGAMLGIRLIDHIIIGDNKYISFKERGLL